MWSIKKLLKVNQNQVTYIQTFAPYGVVLLYSNGRAPLYQSNGDIIKGSADLDIIKYEVCIDKDKHLVRYGHHTQMDWPGCTCYGFTWRYMNTQGQWVSPWLTRDEPVETTENAFVPMEKPNGWAGDDNFKDDYLDAGDSYWTKKNNQVFQVPKNPDDMRLAMKRLQNYIAGAKGMSQLQMDYLTNLMIIWRHIVGMDIKQQKQGSPDLTLFNRLNTQIVDLSKRFYLGR